MVVLERGGGSGGKYSCPLLGKLSSQNGAGISVSRAELDHDRERMLDCPHHLQRHPDDHLLSQLFISQTSVAVMTPSGAQQPLSRHRQSSGCSSIKYEPDPDCPSICHKSNTERVVVALLMGALIIIFLTLVLSLVYLRESQQQHQSLIQYNAGQANSQLSSEERLIRWGAANNVKIKAIKTIIEHRDNILLQPGTSSVSREEMLGTCQLPQCWSRGRQLMLMVDKSVDPCESLYDAACGGWVVNMTGRLSQHQSLDTVSVMDNHKLGIDSKIKDLILLLEDQTPNDENQFGKLKTFYRSCLDTETIRQKGFQPAIDFIQETFGHYLNPEETDSGDLTDVIYAILQYSSTALFDVQVDVDPSDNNNIVGVISLPKPSSFHPRLRDGIMGEKTERWADDNSANSVTNSQTIFKEIQAAATAQKIGKLFSVVENYKILNNYSQPFKQSTTDEIVGFVAALTKMIPGRREELIDSGLNKIYNKYNIAELQSSFRYVDWKLMMRKVFGDKVNNSQLFLVHFPSYLRQLDRMVSLFGLRVARLSLIVLFVQEVLDEVVNFDATGKERWRSCSGLTQIMFPEATSHLYLKSFTEYDRHQMVLKAKELFKGIRKEAIGQLETTGWLTRQTKSKLIQKLATTKVVADPPSFFLNQTVVENKLQEPFISQQHFLENILKLGRSKRLAMFGLKSAGVNEEVFAWTIAASPLDINAFRIRQFNSIVLPFGLLATTSKDAQGVPKYVAEGPLRFIIGHEMMHSLDFSGRGFDLQGRLSMVWDQSSLVRYEKRSECLKKSYSQNHKRQLMYRGQVVPVEVDGDFTFDENMCDVESLEMVSEHFGGDLDNEEQLPGVSFTKEQIFFINIAQGYCGVIGSVNQVLQSHLSRHSTFKERVDGMMMNSRNFAQSFKCPTGSRMNPARKCSHMFGK